MSDSVAVLMPVKAFAYAKQRLAPTFAPQVRARLARAMATHVVAVAAPLPVVVVCDDPEVAIWADGLGAQAIWAPDKGIDNAVEHGVRHLAAGGVEQVIVVPTDLPLAGPLRRLAGHEGVTLVPDRRNDGTNLVCLPTAVDFRFAYGPGSFARHQAEARRLGVPLRVIRDPRLGLDIDLPADLELARKLAPLLAPHLDRTPEDLACR
jgi:2-phospho-L-lactate guanylyltransferase